MCTGFTKDTGQYFMKASPVRPGDYLEIFAEIDLIAGLSACPGGDCSSEHSSDEASCYPLKVEIYEISLPDKLDEREPLCNSYSGCHGNLFRLVLFSNFPNNFLEHRSYILIGTAIRSKI